MNITQNFYDNMATQYDKLFQDWQSTTREQAVILDKMFSECGFDRDAQILDCACGIGTQAIGLASLGYQVTASDISDGELAEAKERAEREKQEAQERAEREAKTWTGASSISELRSKLMGTIWETTYDVLRYKVTFYNDEVNMCITDLSGNRFKDEKTYKYEVMSKGERFVVGFGNVENYETYQIGFLGSRAILFANSNRLGELTFMGR